MSQYDNRLWIRAMREHGVEQSTVKKIAATTILAILEEQMQRNLHKQMNELAQVIEEPVAQLSTRKARRFKS